MAADINFIRAKGGGGDKIALLNVKNPNIQVILRHQIAGVLEYLNLGFADWIIGLKD